MHAVIQGPSPGCVVEVWPPLIGPQILVQKQFHLVGLRHLSPGTAGT